MAYWLFKGNPEYYKFELAIQHGVLDNWGVTHHKNDITIGDKIIIWISGKGRGVAGLAEIIEKPTSDFKPKDEYCWTEKGLKKRNNSKSKEGVYVKINIITDTQHFINPISFYEKAKLIHLPVSRGYQNTNYSITDVQYKEVEKLFN